MKFVRLFAVLLVAFLMAGCAQDERAGNGDRPHRLTAGLPVTSGRAGRGCLVAEVLGCM